MVGETVAVLIREQAGVDAFNDPIWAERRVEVADVLVAPGDSEDVISSVRPDGNAVRYTLYFPKTFDLDIEEQRVEVRGEVLDVVGSPDHFDAGNCPTRWWMTAKVAGTHG